MNWVSSHPYLSSIVFGLVVVIFGASVVMQRTAATPLQYQPSTWSGAGGITASPVASPQSAPQSGTLASNNTSVVPYRYVSPFGTNDGRVAPSAQDDAGLSELEGILTKNTTKDTSLTTANVSDAYQFIPTGMISLPDTSNHDTPPQAELRQFGNDVGSVIQSFEQSNPDQVAVLKNFMEDQNNPDKINGMKRLGGQFKDIGSQISQIDPVPKQMKASLADLTSHYDEIGKLLAAIPDAKGNDALYDAIVTYDHAAERFVTSLVNFALVFPASGVVFSQDEAGSVFMFQQGGSL